MKLIGYFENFIESEVELNKTRKETLDSHIEALEKVIKESPRGASMLWGSLLLPKRVFPSWVRNPEYL